MNIEMSKLDNGIKQINLTGRLDMKGTAQIESTFTIYAATEKAPVLVDMSGVEFIASIGMRMLVMEAKALARRGGKMALLNPTELVAEALRMAGIDELIPIFDDFEAASAHLFEAVAD